MGGEFLYFSIYVVQQLGVMLGVGAQTVMLCTHLVSLHHRETESPLASFATATRRALFTGLLLIIFSGLAAVAVHLLNGNSEIVLAPAFLGKWLLIIVVTSGFILQNRLTHGSDLLAGITGGSWYALFLVHSLAPATSWINLGGLYAIWMVSFLVVWGAFVFLMQKTAKGAVVQQQKPKVILQTPPKPTPPKIVLPPPPVPPAPKPIAPIVVAHVPPPPPKPLPPPPAPVVIKPIPTPPPVVTLPPPPPPPVIAPAPVVVRKQPMPAAAVHIFDVPARLSFFERLKEWFKKLSTPKPKPIVVTIAPPPPAPTPVLPKPVPIVPLPPKAAAPPPLAPPPVVPPAPLLVVRPLTLSAPPPVPAPVPTPAPVAPAPEVTKHSILQDVIDHLLVPALRIMPQRPEDVGKQNRPPVVKLSE